MQFDQLERRQFITLLGGATVLWPLASVAQQAAKVPLIGVLVTGNTDPAQFWRLFRQGLRDLGYVEGQNIRFEFRSAEGQANRLLELAAELVRLNVDVIVTWFTPTRRRQGKRRAKSRSLWRTRAIRSARRLSRAFLGQAEMSPVSLLAGKCVELIRDILPSARRVSALINITDPFSKPFLENIQHGGEVTGTTINSITSLSLFTPALEWRPGSSWTLRRNPMPCRTLALPPRLAHVQDKIEACCEAGRGFGYSHHQIAAE
jgi:putative tryptophan/tyrosine transport system substrate-binding protein